MAKHAPIATASLLSASGKGDRNLSMRAFAEYVYGELQYKQDSTDRQEALQAIVNAAQTWKEDAG